MRRTARGMVVLAARLLSVTLLLIALAACTRAPAGPSPSPTASAPSAVVATHAAVTETPTPSATPSATSTPTPPATPMSAPPSGTRTGLTAVDAVIAAVEAHDVDALAALVRMQQVECGTASTAATPAPPWPVCNGKQPGTRVDAFAAGVCGAVWHRDPRPMLERLVDRVTGLYAVTAGEQTPDANMVGPPIDPGDTRIVWRAAPAGAPTGYVLVVSGGAITSEELGCDSLVLAMRSYRVDPPRVLLRGPVYTTPSPMATPTPPATATPAQTPAPTGAASGVAVVDEVIAAATSGEAARVARLLRPTQAQCSFNQFGLGGPPACAPDETEADVVPVFPIAQCEGSWSRDLDQTAAALAGLRLSPHELYAVTTAGSDYMGGEYWVLFERPAFPSVALVVGGDGVIGIHYLCGGSPGQWLQARGNPSMLLQGPAAAATPPSAAH